MSSNWVGIIFKFSYFLRSETFRSFMRELFERSIHLFKSGRSIFIWSPNLTINVFLGGIRTSYCGLQLGYIEQPTKTTTWSMWCKMLLTWVELVGLLRNFLGITSMLVSKFFFPRYIQVYNQCVLSYQFQLV